MDMVESVTTQTLRMAEVISGIGLGEQMLRPLTPYFLNLPCYVSSLLPFYGMGCLSFVVLEMDIN